MDRSSYREKERPEVTDILRRSYGDPYIIPEGGTNQHALRGCRELAEEILAQTAGSELPDAFGVACGTGGTLAGLTDGFGNSVKGLGISVLKGGFHQNTVGELLEKYAEKPPRNWEIRSGFHFGGYARFTPALIDFINRFKSRHRIPLDPVYTGKLFIAIFHLVENGYSPENSTVLVIHTGGLQGVAGFNERFPDWPIH